MFATIDLGPPPASADRQASSGWELESRSDWGESAAVGGVSATAPAGSSALWNANTAVGSGGGASGDDDGVAFFSEKDWTPMATGGNGWNCWSFTSAMDGGSGGFCCADSNGNGTHSFSDWLVAACCVSDCFIASVCEAFVGVLAVARHTERKQ